MNTLRQIYNYDLNETFEIDYIRAQDPVNSDIIVLVPDQFAFETEKYLVNALGRSGLFNVRVYGLSRLVHEFSTHVGLRPKELLSGLGKELLLMQILKDMDLSLVHFAGAHKSSDYVSALVGQLDSLRSEAIDEQRLKDISGEFLLAKPKLAEKLLELSTILSAYTNALSHANADTISLVSRLTEHFLNDSSNDFSIIVEGFSGMSTAELGLLAAMASSSSGDVFIRVTCAPNGVAARYSDRTVSQIKRAFESLGLDLSCEKQGGSPSVAQTNANFFSSLFDYGSSHFYPNTSFKLISAENREEELSFVCLDILKKMRSGVYTWKDFAILSSSLDPYKRHIHKVLSSLAVPYYMDERLGVIGLNFIAFIVSSLRVVSSGFAQKHVIDTLKLHAFVRRVPLKDGAFSEELLQKGISKAYYDAGKIERHALQFRIDYNKWFDKKLWEEYFCNTHSESEQVCFLKAKNKLLSCLAVLRDELGKSKDLSLKIAALRSFLNAMEFEESLDSQISLSELSADEKNTGKLKGIKRAYDEVFTQIERLAGAYEMETAAFTELVVYAFSAYSAGTLPVGFETVILGSIERTRLLSVKHLYIIGANEGMLPAHTSLSSSVFTSDELSYIDELDMGNFKTAAKFLDKEIFDTYEKILLSQESTTFSYARIDDKKDEINPSYWLNGFKSKGGIESSIFNLQARDVMESGVFAAFLDYAILNYGEPALRVMANTSKGLGELSAKRYINSCSAFDLAKTSIDARLSQKSIEDYGRHLIKSNEDIRTYETSVSRLETQAKCPFMYFAQYVLRPRRLESRLTDSMVLGNIVHRTLEKLVRAYLDASDKDAYINDIKAKFTAIFRLELKEEKLYRLNAAAARPLDVALDSLHIAAESILRQLNTGTCALECETELDFRCRFERNIERDSSPKSKEVLILSGIVDRLDKITYGGGEYLRIVDYKTGRSKYDADKTKLGIQLQLSTYLEALLKIESEKSGNQVLPLGMYYFSLKENFSNSRDFLDADEKKLGLYRLDGRTLGDAGLVTAANPNLGGDFAPMTNTRVSSKGKFYSNSNVMSMEEFTELFEHSDKNRWELIDGIVEGNIDLNPSYLPSETLCKHCSYRSICKMDVSRYRDKFRRSE